VRNQRGYVLRKVNRLESGGYGPGAVRTCPAFGSAGNSWMGLWVSVREATVTCCGVAVAMPQGQSWAPPSSSESTVNVGTVPVLARFHAPGVAVRVGSIVGRSVRDGAEPP
jgi:hypothetical protein